MPTKHLDRGLWMLQGLFPKLGVPDKVSIVRTVVLGSILGYPYSGGDHSGLSEIKLERDDLWS